MFTQFVERIPMPTMTQGERDELGALASRASSSARLRYSVDEKTRHRLGDLIPAGRKINNKLTKWWDLDFSALSTELRQTFKAEIPVRQRDEWESLWMERRSEHAQLTASIVGDEAKINGVVYRLFGLSADDVRVIEEETKYESGEV